MALSQTSVLKLYHTVMEDVIAGVRESFNDEGVDEQVLLELKQIWETKLMSNKAVELNPEPIEPQPPQLNTHKPNASKGTTVIQQQQSQSQAQSQQQSSQQQQFVNKPVALQSQSTVQQVVTAPSSLMERQVPIQITLPAQGDSPSRVLTIHVPVSAIQSNTLQNILTAAIINAAMAMPQDIATALLQQHVNNALQGQAGLAPVQKNGQQGNISQMDGANGDSSDDDEEEDEEDNDDDDEDLDDREEEENDESKTREEEPLNSGDDVSDEDDPQEMFDTENVVVCQYDKITRSRNKWKFYLKDGIMNLNSKDYVFQKANGDAEW